MRLIFFIIYLITCLYQTAHAQDLLAEAKSAYEQELFMKVLKITDKVLVENPKSSQAWLIHANALQKLEDYQGAIASYKRALKLNDDSPEIHTNIGVAYYNSDDISTAQKYLKKALKLNDEYSPAHYFMGNLQYADFKSKSALKCYERAIELNPKYRDALYMRSAVYFELGEYQKALKDINTVIEIDPSLERAKFNKAIILLTAENYDGAMKVLTEVHPKVLDKQTDYFYYLGEAQYFSGQKDDACESYSKAAELGDTESEEIFTRFCLTNAERKAREQKRTISMSF